MHIKRIEIDGFKSYAQKQVINDFDVQFNAITGLNGSGKSNILDSICYVLGINDLKCIRAENMNALVYKSGQAGVTKASVTITFDNRDKQNSPMGYYDYDEIIVRRQVIVNGRTSYTINGSAMTNQRVSDFFRSVGLNVNNPHFLIMQGRITKVLNMKPHEILGMVEEAAGTKMYDAKRTQALTFMEKKQHKVDEIQNLLNNEIRPKVARLEEEQATFAKHQALGGQIDLAKKKISAFDYWQYTQDEAKLRQEAVSIEEEADTCREKILELRQEEKEIAVKIAEVEAKKSAKCAEDEAQLRDKLMQLKGVRVQAEADRDEVNTALTETQVEIDRVVQDNTTEKITLEQTRRKLEQNEKNFGGEEEMGKKAEQTVTMAKAKLEAIAKGLSTDEEGRAVTLEAQITNTKSALTEVSTKVKTAEMKRTKIEPELERKRCQLEQMTKQSNSDIRELEKCEADVKNYESKLKKVNFDINKYEELSNRKAELHRRVLETDHEMQRWSGRKGAQAFEFRYTKPKMREEFDPVTEIIGPLITLINVKDKKAHGVAIETAAGGILYNIVFAHQRTCAYFVDNNLMQSRKTLIPLDKVEPNPGLSATVSARYAEAKKIAKAQNKDVHLAIDLIDYDPKYKKVMEFVFKGILVTDDPKLATELAFHKNVGLKCVTLEGDLASPGGILSGGTKRDGPVESLFVRFDSYFDTVRENRAALLEQRSIQSTLEEMSPAYNTYRELHQQLTLSQGKLETLRDALKNSPIQILRDEIAQMEIDLPQCKKDIADSQEEMKRLQKKVKDLEERKKNEKAYQETEKKKYEKELKDAQQTLKSIKTKFENARDTLDRLRKEVEKVEDNIKKQEDEISTLQARRTELSDELTAKEDAVRNAYADENAQQELLNEFMNEQKAKDNEIKKARKEEDKIKKAIREIESEITNKERARKKCLDDAAECNRLAVHIKKSCKFIADIETALGKSGDYSFKEKEEQKKLDEMTVEREHIGKTLNPQAQVILDTAKSQVADLEAKLTQVIADKNTLLDTIKTLDEKKRKEILKAHEQVTKDLGNIYSTLLKDAMAKLEPPAGKTPLEGLEVKVGFNGKWKESLNELSGGQRSLVALSLVLAMLKFKPAPIYILDEVDSALDLSHTQNIGTMIKNHFTTSQFIVVSLKEGMFKHANVIYRTKFVDGTSQVIRTIGEKLPENGQTLPASEKGQAERGESPHRKKGRK